VLVKIKLKQMKEKIEQHRQLTNEITKFAKEEFKKFFKGKEHGKVSFEQWVITPNNELKIFYKFENERIPDFFIVNL
jgi:hypothetical protein